MKTIKKLLVVLLFIISLSGCSFSKPLKFFIISDTHYFSKELHDEGSMYLNSLTQTIMLEEYSNEILDEFIEVAKKEKLPFLIVAGDLTFNGELKSLEELSLKFKEIEDNGTEVIVIPGNHDMYYNKAYSYSGDTFSETTYIQDEDYLRLMGDFGYSEAIYKDEYTFSYIYKLNEDNYVLMLDANHIGTRGSIAKSTLDFIDEAMPKLEGKHVFAVCHQPIYRPFDKDYFGYNVYNDKQIIKSLNTYGISEVYVGHIHSERDKNEYGIHQQTVASLIVDDLRYSTVEIKDGVHKFESYVFSTFVEQGQAKRNKVVNNQLLQ